MNIIDHMYIGVLPPPIHHAIKANLLLFAQHQQQQHTHRYPQASLTRAPSLMSVYHDKSTDEPLLRQALRTVDMPHDAKFHTLYTQAWSNVTLALLQRPKIVQLIIDALIYNHASRCISTPPHPLSHPTNPLCNVPNIPSHVSSSRITTSPPTPPPSHGHSPASQDTTRAPMTGVPSTNAIPSPVDPPDPEILTVPHVNSLTMLTTTPSI